MKEQIFLIFPRSLQERAEKLYSSSSFDQVRKLREKSTDDKWLFFCAQKYLDLKEYRIAEHFYNQALVVYPYMIFCHAGLAACYLSLDKLSKALKSMAKAISILINYELSVLKTKGLDPHIRNTSIPIKDILFYKDQIIIGDASLHFLDSLDEDAFTNDDDFAKVFMQPALYHFGNYSRSKGRYPEAIVCFKLAIRIEPNDCKSQTNLGTCLAEFGEIQEAFTELSKAVILDKSDAVAHSGLGVVYSIRGEQQKALEYLQKAINIKNGNYPFAEEYYKKIRATLDKHYIFNEKVKLQESKSIEFKGLKEAQVKLNPKEFFQKIYNYIIEYTNAFLNSHPGTLYLGIEDDGVVTGIIMNKKQIDDLNNYIDQSFFNIFKPCVDPEYYSIDFIPVLQTHQNVYVIEVKIQRGSANVYIVNSKKDGMKAFIRQLGGTFPMPFEMLMERLSKRNL